jgi:hypothetical protein
MTFIAGDSRGEWGDIIIIYVYNSFMERITGSSLYMP